MRAALECAHRGWGQSVIIGVAGEHGRGGLAKWQACLNKSQQLPGSWSIMPSASPAAHEVSVRAYPPRPNTSRPPRACSRGPGDLHAAVPAGHGPPVEGHRVWRLQVAPAGGGPGAWGGDQTVPNGVRCRARRRGRQGRRCRSKRRASPRRRPCVAWGLVVATKPNPTLAARRCSPPTSNPRYLAW